MNIRWLYSHRTLVSLFVTAAVAVALMTILVIRQQQGQANGQIFLEAGGSVGLHPFVPLISPPATTGEDPTDPAGNGDSGGTSFPTTATVDNRPACDAERLISYLTDDPQAGAAWVRALNSDRTLSWSGGSRIEALQIPTYIRELGPRVLVEDLRVTNHQFTGGATVAVQSVLEKGTAILVDAQGVPRVRCASGNPLTPMVQLKAPPVYRGAPWPGFQPQRVVAAQHAPQCGRDEHFDGNQCRRITVCPLGENGGDDGSCDGPGRSGPSDNGKRPDDGQQWSDRPGQPGEPPYSASPVYPSEPPHSDKPVRSDGRSYPGRPGHPGEPPYSGNSGHPGEPPHSDKPVRSDGRSYPGRPGHPGEPPRSDTPVRPDERPHSGIPGYPDEPPRTDRPVRPDERSNTGTPGHPGGPPHSDRPVRPVKTEKPKHPEKAGKPDGRQADQPTQPGQDKRPDKSKRAEKPDKDERPDKAGKSVQADKDESVQSEENSE